MARAIKAHAPKELVPRDVEKQMLEVVLANAEGNQTLADNMLGINRHAPRRMLRKHKIKP